MIKKIFIPFSLQGLYRTGPGYSVSHVDEFSYNLVIWHEYNFYVSHIINILDIGKIRTFGNNLFKQETINEHTISRTISYVERPNYNYIANVSYLYNYEEAPSDGYYWVDNYDSSLIEYIPPEPIREGYEFAGWYKEAECINKWDFSKDKTSDLYRRYYEPDENDSEEYKKEYYEYISTHTYVETKLYAKWIKK